MVISNTVLVVAGPFGDALSASDVARAIGLGLVAGGLPQPDLCPIEAADRPAPVCGVRAVAEQDPGSQRRVAPEMAAMLQELDFDTRMRRARAVVLVEWRLQEQTLRGSVTFEIATRARQGGVPAYAVSGEDTLEPFDARMLDLQIVLEADGKRALANAGRELAGLL